MYQQFIKKCYPFANRLHKSAAKVQLFSEITKNSLFFLDFLGNYIRVDTDFIFKIINVNQIVNLCQFNEDRPSGLWKRENEEQNEG